MKILNGLLLGLLAWVFSASLALSVQSNLPKAGDNLVYLIRPGENEGKKVPLLVLMHGYGSNEEDLFSFAPQIPKEWMVVSVRAPFKLGEGQYCWYNFQRTAAKVIINAYEEQQSRARITELLQSFISQGQVDPSRVVVAGFSQGAIMSQSLALSKPELFAGFAMFSGRTLEETKPIAQSQDKLKHLQVFVSHGKQDRVLPYAYADETTAYLKGLGLIPTFVQDGNEHNISKVQFDGFRGWLSGIFGR